MFYDILGYHVLQKKLKFILITILSCLYTIISMNDEDKVALGIVREQLKEAWYVVFVWNNTADVLMDNITKYFDFPIVISPIGHPPNYEFFIMKDTSGYVQKAQKMNSR